MTEPLEPIEEPANLRFLRRLVTVLTSVMIIGILVIVGLLILRLSSEGNTGGIGATLPANISLPEGTTAQAFTVGPDWYAVVTGDNRILIFDRPDGALRQEIRIDERQSPGN